MRELKLNFKGYCLSTNPTIPTSPGVYVIYETEPNTDKDNDKDVDKRYGKYIKALRYIGQAKDLHARIRQHAIDNDYPIENEYFYTYATVPEQEIDLLDLLDLVKAALVFQFCPQDNEDLLKNKYTFEDVDITIKGSCIGMQDFRLFNGTERF